MISSLELIADIFFQWLSSDSAWKPIETFVKNSLPSFSIRSSFLFILLFILSSTGMSRRNVISGDIPCVAIVSRSTSMKKLKKVNTDLMKLVKIKKIEILKL